MRIKEQKDSIASKHSELRKAMSRKDKLLKRNDDLELQIKKKESELSNIKNDNKEGYDRIRNLEQQHKWIETDRDYFGAKNTKYDYSKENPEESGEKLRTATEQFNKVKKRINEKAMMLLEREEEELKSVCDRKGIVENDRKKIKGILKDLDAEKMELLRKAWQQVTENFGNIFSVLLPGAQATLVPSPGMEFYQGLNIKVGFNDVWKESLTELSGGQRSLVALSLILAMLKYKPAPIYILDEVDAALDMSHTQNIGRMLKMHFTNSQVSNASVQNSRLFRITQYWFVDFDLFAVHHSVAEGWHVQQRQRHLQDEIRKWCIGCNPDAKRSPMMMMTDLNFKITCKFNHFLLYYNFINL